MDLPNALAFLSIDSIRENLLYDGLKAAFLTGAIFAARWFNNGKKLTRAKTWGFGLTVFALALFVVAGWRSLVNANRGAGRYAGPLFKVSAGNLVFVEGTNAIPLILCEMQIYNAGMSPSIVRAWTLQVNLPGLAPVQAMQVKFHNNIGSLITNLPLAFRGVEQLDDITSTSAINPGNSAKGFVAFHLPGVSPDRYNLPGALFRVTFKDVDDITYPCDYSVTMNSLKQGFLVP